MEITTEQFVTFNFKAEDGRKRPVALDGTPVAASSDETVATVTLTANADGKTWDGRIDAVAPGDARIVVTGDGAEGEDVLELVGTADITVTLDGRSKDRMVEMTLGTPTDKEVA